MLQEQGEELCILIGQALMNIIGEAVRVEVGTGPFKAPDIGSIGFAFANINIQFRDRDIQAFGAESQDRILDGLEGNMIELPVPLDADALIGAPRCLRPRMSRNTLSRFGCRSML